MTKLPKAILTTAAGLALLTAAAGTALAHGAGESAGMMPRMQPAHMGQGSGGESMGPSYGAAPCPGRGMGMGPGMMGPGMMGPGMMGQGMMPMMQQMHRGMMGHGMMGPGMMGHGMWGRGYGHGPVYGKPTVQPDKDLSADDVRAQLERSLKWHGNERLKVGEVQERDDDTIVAEIVTQDGSLVDRFEVDRHSGWMHRVE